MPATSRRKPARVRPSPAQLLDSALQTLAAMPAARRNAYLSLIDFLAGMPKENLAVFAKAAMPELGDGEISALCGVTRRTLYRWARYREFKPRLADYKDALRRRQSGRKEE